MKNFSTIHARTPKVYDTHANSWDTNRPRALTERKWLDKFIAVIRPRSEILDVGCGGGDPVARYFIEQGFSVTGIDIANAMIDIAQSRFPTITWVQMDMRALDFGQKFDGIVSWDSFFHLSPEEQRLTLTHFFNHLKPGGAMLLTVGDKEGEVLGQVEGEEVYHSSLDPLEYKRIFSSAGFSEVEYMAQDQQCGLRSILLAYH